MVQLKPMAVMDMRMELHLHNLQVVPLGSKYNPKFHLCQVSPALEKPLSQTDMSKL